MSRVNYKDILLKSKFAFAYCSIVKDKSGNAIDYKFIEVNDSFGKILCLETKDIIGKSIKEIASDSDLASDSRIELYSEISETGSNEDFEYYSEKLLRWFNVNVFSNEKGYFVATFIESPNDEKRFERNSYDENEIEQNIEDAEFLNSLSFQFAELDTGEDIVPTLLTAIKSHTDAALAVFSVYDPIQKALIIKRIEANDSIFKLIIKIAGEKIIETVSPVDEDTYSMIVNDKIGYAKTFTEVTFGAIPEMVDKTIRAITGIAHFFGIAHIINGELYGTTMLTFKHNQKEPSRKILNSYAYFVALTLRKKIAERSLRTSEERFRLLTDLLPQTVFEADLSGRLTFANRSAFETFGYSQEEFDEGISCFKIIANDEIVKAQTNFKKIIDSNIPSSHEYLAVRKDGTRFPIIIFSSLITSEGLPIGIRGIIIDISDRKEAEKVIEESEKRFRLLVKNSNDIIMVLSNEGKYKYVSDQVVKVLGYTAEELIGKSFFDYMHQDDISALAEKFQHCMEKEGCVNNAIYRNKHKDGSWVYIEAIGSNLLDEPSVNGMVINARDISERIKTEADLKETMERFQAFMDNVPSLVCIKNENSSPIFFNKEFIKQFPCDDWLGAIPMEVLPYKTADEMLRTDREAIEKGFCIYEDSWQDNEGQWRTLETRKFRISRGELPPYIGVVINDVSERKIAEAAIKDSEERFRNLTNLLPLTVYETDINGNITFINQTALDTFGYDAEDIMHGFNAFEVIYDFKIDIQKYLAASGDSKKKFNKIQKREVEAIRKDGSKFPAMIFSNILLKDDQPIGFRGVVIDISEQKESERKIKELNENLEQKVLERTVELNKALKIIEESNYELKYLNDSIADEARKLIATNDRLAKSEQELLIANQTKDKFFSIIAHDLKNPIGGIRNLLEIIVSHYDKMDSSEVLQLIQGAYSASIRTFELLDNLLEWARIQRGAIYFEPHLSIIKSILDKVLGLVKSNADSKFITIESILSETDMAYFDRDFLNAILRNLISNAIKYSKPNSKVTIAFEAGSLYSPELSEFYVCSVKDEGIGIDEDRLNGLFKVDSIKSTTGTLGEKGTGLGLVLCKEFVEKQGGKIWAESKVGCGSTFYFTLPLETIDYQ